MLESKTVSSMDAGMHVPNHVDLRIVTESGKQNKKKGQSQLKCDVPRLLLLFF